MKTNEEEMGGDIQSEMLKKNNYERSREVYDKIQFTGHKSKRDTEVL